MPSLNHFYFIDIRGPSRSHLNTISSVIISADTMSRLFKIALICILAGVVAKIGKIPNENKSTKSGPH